METNALVERDNQPNRVGVAACVAVAAIQQWDGNNINIIEATPRNERWKPTLWWNGTTNQTEWAQRYATMKHNASDAT